MHPSQWQAPAAPGIRMSFLDLRTIYFSHGLTSTICVLVLLALWLLNRQQSPAIGLWLMAGVLQLAGGLMLVLPGLMPAALASLLGNPLTVAGVLLQYIGLERYLGKTSPQRYNYFALAVFCGLHAYFTLVRPSLQARNLNLSAGLIVFVAQGAWLLLRRAEAETRQATRPVGLILAGYLLVSVGRLLADLFVPAGQALFQSGLYDRLVILSYQVLVIALTFALVLMVNGRLRTAFEKDLLKREQSEAALRQNEQALRESEFFFREAQRIGFIGAYKLDFVSGYWESTLVLDEIFGIDRAYPRSIQGWLNLVHPDDREIMAHYLQEHVIAQRKAFDHEYRIVRRADGRVRWLMGTGQIEVDAAGAVVSLLGTIQDITARRLAEEAVRQSEARLERAESVAHFGYWEFDLVDRIVRASAGARLIYGLQGDIWSIAEVQTIPLPEYRLALDSALTNLIQHNLPYNLEFRVRRPTDGQLRDIHSIAEFDAAHRRVFGVIHDITERKQAEEALRAQLAEIQTLQARLQEQAIRDPLTGLFNRRFMEETFDRELARATREQYPVGLMMLDLDHFKPLNDSYGHQAGDLVLQAVGDLLRRHTRQNDVACRFGGEEFIVILPGASLELVMRRAEALRMLLADHPIPSGDQSLHVTTSVGVAVFPQHGQDIDALLGAVDQALYQAKSAGRNCVMAAAAPATPPD
jgi:diguanylate cyclase (GGDEF)-like protein/PAS domain S-box-containing protein